MRGDDVAFYKMLEMGVPNVLHRMNEFSPDFPAFYLCVP